MDVPLYGCGTPWWQMARKPRRLDPEREAHWRTVLETFHRSQMPFKKFFEQERISPNTFQYWRSELRRRDEANGIESRIKKGDNRTSQAREKKRFWLDIIGKAQNNTGSISAFCREHKITSGSLYHWEKRLIAEGLTNGFSEKNILIPVRVVDAPGRTLKKQSNARVSQEDRRIEIRTRSGDSIFLPRDFAPAALIEIARGLGDEKC